MVFLTHARNTRKIFKDMTHLLHRDIYLSLLVLLELYHSHSTYNVDIGQIQELLNHLEAERHFNTFEKKKKTGTIWACEEGRAL
jgi:hypothetical protein